MSEPVDEEPSELEVLTRELDEARDALRSIGKQVNLAVGVAIVLFLCCSGALGVLLLVEAIDLSNDGGRLLAYAVVTLMTGMLCLSFAAIYAVQLHPDMLRWERYLMRAFALGFVLSAGYAMYKTILNHMF